MRNPYSASAIQRCVRGSDSRDFNINLAEDRSDILEAALADSIAEPSHISNPEAMRVGDRWCYFYRDYSAHLIVRATSRYLSQRFRVTAPNRDRVVQAVIEGMCEGAPFHVIRRDIRSFYENIPTSDLRNRLLFDTAIPKQLRRHLSAYFAIAPDAEKGLPRGIALTTILAELAMHEFDQNVRSLPGVYRYFRYSDDILIFCTCDPKTIEPMLGAALPKGMWFNQAKCSTSSFVNENPSHTDGFDYLGYHFQAETVSPKKGKPRSCEVSIASIKIKKMKTRIALSLRKYDGIKHNLLLYRMRYLSGNYRVRMLPGHFDMGRQFTRSGIYFNYKRCGLYSGPKYTSTPRTELMALDWYFHRLLFSSKSVYAGNISANVPPATLAQLRSISFNKGHTDKIFARVPKGRSSEVKLAWKGF